MSMSNITLNINTLSSQALIVKNFIDEYTVTQLNKWTLENYNNSFFKDANMGSPGTRLTTRYSQDFLFPDIAYIIKEKISNLLQLDYRVPSYKDGIVNGIGFIGGSIREHKDPIWYPDTFTLHCNIISQKPISGGVTFINGTSFETQPGDLLLYPVSELYHSVDTIQGNIPRILWVFGYSIDNESKIY